MRHSDLLLHSLRSMAVLSGIRLSGEAAKKKKILMSHNKGETAHGYHCPDDISVCMREVLVRTWAVGVCVPLALRLSSYK